MIAVIDYGLGNIQNVLAALDYLNLKYIVDIDGSRIGDSHVCLIPGVANFGAGISGLHNRNQFHSIIDFSLSERRVVGLCLGAQMLFESSEESPEAMGLGLIPGAVTRLNRGQLRVPNQGWSKLSPTGSVASLNDTLQNYFYFSHSYEMTPKNKSDIAASAKISNYALTAFVRHENNFAVQFHPERSGPAGLKLLGQLLEETSLND